MAISAQFAGEHPPPAASSWLQMPGPSASGPSSNICFTFFTMTKPYSRAAQAVIDAIFANEYASTMEIAAKAIEEAAKQLIVKTNPNDHLLTLAFLALANELRGKLLSEASYEALSEKFPALAVSDSDTMAVLTSTIAANEEVQP